MRPADSPDATAPAARPGAVSRRGRQALRFVLHLVADAAAIALAHAAAWFLRFSFDPLVSLVPLQGPAQDWDLYQSLLFTIVPVWLMLLGYSARVYTSPWMGPYDRFLQICKAAVPGTLLTLAATYIYGRLEYSRLVLLMAGPLAVVALSAAHSVVCTIDQLVARFETTSPVLLLGGGRLSEMLRAELAARHPRQPVHEIAEVPSAEALAKLVGEVGCRELVLLRTDLDRRHLTELANACEDAGIELLMVPDLLELRLGELHMDDSLGLPALRLRHAQLTGANFVAKRAFDVLFSLAVLGCLSVPLLTIAVLIRLESPGPVLFRQSRLGFRGRTFEAYKFRTMLADAETRIGEVRAKDGTQVGFFKAKDDPRVTRVGRVLRRFSMDEFPQFLNVLKGDMSVVGPRPLAVSTGEMAELIEQFGPTASKRLNAVPGITGLWQVSGRSDLSAHQRFALDMFYIERWTLGMDLEIVLKTVPAMVSGRGAY